MIIQICLLYGANYRAGDGSFKAFYETSSGGQLTVTVDVKGWYRAANNFQYYAKDSGDDRAADLVREAVDAAEVAGTNFLLYDNDSDGDVDGILSVHSGPGAEIGAQSGLYIWSHRWVLNGGNLGAAFYDGVTINDYMINPETRSAADQSISGIGVFCHEFGHNLGLPDLYDTDNTNGDSEGIGNWGLMAAGSYSGSSNRPSNFSAWCKEELGWDTPQNITIGNTGSYSLNPSSTSRDEILRVNTSLSNEYFLIENRQLTGKDSDLPGHGLAIWHINTTKTNSSGNSVNANGSLKGVDLEEADGNNDLDNKVNRGDPGDLFPGTSNLIIFDDNSNPSAQNYLLGNTGLQIRNIVETVGGAVSFDFGQAPGPPCSASTTFTTNTGSFDDGSGPGLDYVNNQTCAWLITPVAGSVTLSFSAFDIEAIYDTVTVYDGANINAQLIGKFSGNSIPVNITSSSNAMFVQFKSNATLNGSGFDASFITNSPSLTQTGPAGVGSTVNNILWLDAN
ncbi:MAG: M6 family metalloprotease-like protein, partial [Vicingaceae bacterium]